MSNWNKTVEVPTSVNFDYLEAPAIKNGTPADAGWALQQTLKDLLGSIRHELLKLNPEVLTETNITGGGNSITPGVKKVWFEFGGKPTTVYKTILWNQTAQTINVSFSGMTEANDGFSISSVPVELNVPLSELYVILPAGTTMALNNPTSLVTNGSFFIYGFTIPNYESEQR